MLAKKSFALVLALIFVLMTCFIGFGYAAITDNLTTFGDASVQIPKGLFITEITE